MHAIIRQGNGKYYISAVFGYYRDISAVDYYESNPYWIVWDAEMKHLIRWLAMTPNTKYLIPQILIIDSDQENWNIDNNGIGCVNFLSGELLDSILDKDDQPEDILEKCRLMDAGYVYEEVQEIRNAKDIEDLEWASGGFHDARIAKEELLQDGTLYLRFDGTWGCEIEVWFSGDLEYDTSSRNPDNYDPYWLGSTIILKDGFVYFVDEEDMTVDRISEGYCYFKARHMKYRIIPD